MHPAFKKDVARGILYTTVRDLREEGFDELAVAIEFLLAAVNACDDPREVHLHG